MLYPEEEDRLLRSSSRAKRQIRDLTERVENLEAAVAKLMKERSHENTDAESN
jgi:uncharacterized protein (UPF0335 family)